MPSEVEGQPANQLALLIGAIPEGETAMAHDIEAMRQALSARGFAADQILSLQGRLERPLVTSFLQAASRQVAGWAGGCVLLYVSGHGFVEGETEADARPGLLFTAADRAAGDDYLFWDDVFAALVMPAAVRLILLPDL